MSRAPMPQKACHLLEGRGGRAQRSRSRRCELARCRPAERGTRRCRGTAASSTAGAAAGSSIGPELGLVARTRAAPGARSGGGGASASAGSGAASERAAAGTARSDGAAGGPSVVLGSVGSSVGPASAMRAGSDWVSPSVSSIDGGGVALGGLVGHLGQPRGDLARVLDQPLALLPDRGDLVLGLLHAAVGGARAASRSAAARSRALARAARVGLALGAASIRSAACARDFVVISSAVSCACWRIARVSSLTCSSA